MRFTNVYWGNLIIVVESIIIVILMTAIAVTNNWGFTIPDIVSIVVTLFAGIASSIVAWIVWEQQKKSNAAQTKADEDRNKLLSEQNNLQEQLINYQKKSNIKQLWIFLTNINYDTRTILDDVVTSICSIGSDNYNNQLQMVINKINVIEQYQIKHTSYFPDTLQLDAGRQGLVNTTFLLYASQEILIMAKDLMTLKKYSNFDNQNVTVKKGIISNLEKIILLVDSTHEPLSWEKENPETKHLQLVFLKLRMALTIAKLDNKECYHKAIQELLDLTKIPQLPTSISPKCVSEYQDNFRFLFEDENGLYECVEKELFS